MAADLAVVPGDHCRCCATTRSMAAKFAAMTQETDAAADQAAAGQAGTGSRQARSAAAAARTRRARARAACAASLLRWIYSMTVHGTSWDPAAAAGAAPLPATQAEAA